MRETAEQLWNSWCPQYRLEIMRQRFHSLSETQKGTFSLVQFERLPSWVQLSLEVAPPKEEK